MQICCTKKLTNLSGVEVDDTYSEKNKFFIWSANITCIRCRKMLVAVNDCTDFCFVKYGIEIEDFKNLEKYLKSGIRKAFSDELIEAKAIDDYLDNAGKIVFSCTKGPSHVSKLNRALMRAESYCRYFDISQTYQAEATRMTNGHVDYYYGKGKKPYENLKRQIRLMK